MGAKKKFQLAYFIIGRLKMFLTDIYSSWDYFDGNRKWHPVLSAGITLTAPIPCRNISASVQWRHNSPTSLLFIQPFIQAQIKENAKAPRHCPLCGEFTGDRWIPRTKDQWRGKCFHLMTSSWIILLHLTVWTSPTRKEWTISRPPAMVWTDPVPSYRRYKMAYRPVGGRYPRLRGNSSSHVLGSKIARLDLKLNR